MVRSVRLLIATAAALCAAGQQSTVTEDEIKAAYLFNFAKFVEWPASATGASETPLVFCVAGGSRVRPILQDIARSRTVKGRRLVTRSWQPSSGSSDCHIVFVGAMAPERSEAALRAFRETSALTVADSTATGRAHAIIVFVKEAAAVRFEVDVGAARESGIEISSQLLKVAKAVRGGAGTSGADGW